MARITGLGGVFFKARNPEGLRDWYCQHFGLKPGEGFSGIVFVWRDEQAPDKQGQTVWGTFPENTTYFQPSQKPFMLNYRVDNLDEILAQLRSAGVQVEDKIQEYDYGRFGYVSDPEGNRLELWEPAAGTAGK